MTKKVKDNQSELSDTFSSDSEGDDKDKPGNESW